MLSTLRLSEDDEKSDESYSESDLEGRLSNPNGEGEDSEKAKSESEKLAQTDFQLYEALNLLKGLTILGEINQS